MINNFLSTGWAKKGPVGRSGFSPPCFSFFVGPFSPLGRWTGNNFLFKGGLTSYFSVSCFRCATILEIFFLGILVIYLIIVTFLKINRYISPRYVLGTKIYDMSISVTQ